MVRLLIMIMKPDSLVMMMMVMMMMMMVVRMENLIALQVFVHLLLGAHLLKISSRLRFLSLLQRFDVGEMMSGAILKWFIDI